MPWSQAEGPIRKNIRTFHVGNGAMHQSLSRVYIQTVCTIIDEHVFMSSFLSISNLLAIALIVLLLTWLRLVQNIFDEKLLGSKIVVP